MDKKVIIAGIVILSLGGFWGYRSLFMAKEEMDKFIAKKVYAGNTRAGTGILGRDSEVVISPPNYCPVAEDLYLKEGSGGTWFSKDGKWQSDSASSATKVAGFLGAQWLGIKIGKIICLYQTNEAVAFPLAFEQARSQVVLEPTGGGWSALIDNHKLCKSASVADCAYLVQQLKQVEIYSDIKYNPLQE